MASATFLGGRRFYPAWLALLLAILFAMGASAATAACVAAQTHAMAGMTHDCNGKQGVPECPVACGAMCALRAPETVPAGLQFYDPTAYFVAAALKLTSGVPQPEPPPPRGRRVTTFSINRGFS